MSLPLPPDSGSQPSALYYNHTRRFKCAEILTHREFVISWPKAEPRISENHLEPRFSLTEDLAMMVKPHTEKNIFLLYLPPQGLDLSSCLSGLGLASDPLAGMGVCVSLGLI